MLLSLEEKWGVVLTVAVVYEFIKLTRCVKGGPCLLKCVKRSSAFLSYYNECTYLCTGNEISTVWTGYKVHLVL